MTRNRERRRRPTMKDVAERAGVSRTTVSFVLNGRDDMRISSEAQERVRRAARELDYRPNLAARSLHNNLTKTVAVLSSGVVTQGFAGPMIEGCIRSAAEAGYMVFIGEAGGDRRLETLMIDEFIGRDVDGFVYASTFGRAVVVPRALRDKRLVLLNCVSEDGRHPAVLPDSVVGGRQVVEHLIELGHRDGIVLVGETPPGVLVAGERRTGIEEALAEHGVSLAATIPCKWWPESAFEWVSDHLETRPRPRALVCLNDRIALGAYQALQSAGCAIPGDVSVVSFDDSPLAPWLQPPLTSASLPYEEMAHRAMALLLDDRPHQGVHRLPMRVRTRGSSASPQ